MITWLYKLKSRIMDCMLLTFENRVPLMRWSVSVVWHLSLPLINSFNKTKAAVFPCRLCFLGAFTFLSLILTYPQMYKYIIWTKRVDNNKKNCPDDMFYKFFKVIIQPTPLLNKQSLSEILCLIDEMRKMTVNITHQMTWLIREVSLV